MWFDAQLVRCCFGLRLSMPIRLIEDPLWEHGIKLSRLFDRSVVVDVERIGQKSPPPSLPSALIVQLIERRLPATVSASASRSWSRLR